MNTKHQILSKLRRQIVDQVNLPESAEGPWIEYEKPLEQFRSVVKMVGGACHPISIAADALETLQEFEQWRDAKRIYSNIPEIPGNVDLDSVEDPHGLENLDFVVYRAKFAVAENGSVFVSDRDLKHRVVFFITQFLVILVNSSDIVSNMHQAYSRAEIPQPGFGLFLSGPSKTADIEQSLVIGAHGCRELQVFLCG